MQLISSLLPANIFTNEAIFLLSYKNFEPIKIKSTTKIFCKKFCNCKLMKKMFVEIINQLSDNYSYLIFENSSSSAIIVDPAEEIKYYQYLKKKLNLDYIFITHHHNDHTSGVLGLLKKYPNAIIYSPSA